MRPYNFKTWNLYRGMFFFLCEEFHLLKHFWSISYFFLVFWAPEALGPLPNCRSHFSASNRGIETFWILQNTSFMTKQCPQKKKQKFHEVFPLVFLIFSLFFQLPRLREAPGLRDRSQIVDLIFAVRTVASRASESPKTSFMTKQCSSPNPVFCVFPYNWCLVI